MRRTKVNVEKRAISELPGLLGEDEKKTEGRRRGIAVATEKMDILKECNFVALVVIGRKVPLMAA